MDIQQIHEEVFVYLHDLYLKEKDKGNQFYFTLRKTNRYSRLENGYWFHGNEGYIALSFWSGFDYANKTPNLCYQIFAGGETRLVLVARDNEDKSKFIDEQLLPLYPKYSKRGYSRYDIVIKGSYMDALKNFIKEDKPKIDSIIKKYRSEYFRVINDQEAISFISYPDFNFSLRRTMKWRDLRNKKLLSEDEINERPFLSIEKLNIKSFGPIQNLSLNLANVKPQFIFLTGENGGGKSSLLRAMTLAITGDQQFVKFGDFHVEITLRRGKSRRNRIVKKK